MKKKRKSVRLAVPVDVFYRCPKCDWVGYCVTDRFYLQCGNARGYLAGGVGVEL